jgi:hypothetical protein
MTTKIVEPEKVESYILDIAPGQLFLGQVSKDAHVKTRTGSIRVTDGHSFDDEELLAYNSGYVKVLERGTEVTFTVE